MQVARRGNGADKSQNKRDEYLREIEASVSGLGDARDGVTNTSIEFDVRDENENADLKRILRGNIEVEKTPMARSTNVTMSATNSTELSWNTYDLGSSKHSVAPMGNFGTSKSNVSPSFNIDKASSDKRRRDKLGVILSKSARIQKRDIRPFKDAIHDRLLVAQVNPTNTNQGNLSKTMRWRASQLALSLSTRA